MQRSGTRRHDATTCGRFPPQAFLKMQPLTNGSTTRAAITAVGHFLPKDRLTNAELEKLVDTTDEWIVSRTGIRERRILRDPGKATAYMASEAAKDLLEKRAMDAEEIDAIIVATVTPDMFFPSTACLVQAEIGASSAWGFDLSAACTGFIFALSTGVQMVESGRSRNVLVIGADKMSSITNYEDRSTCILFGDAAAAVLLEPHAGDCGFIDFYHRIDGRHGNLLRLPAGGSLMPPTLETVDRDLHYLQQAGRSVFKYAVDGMCEATETIMKRNGLTADGIRYLIPHQANQRIIDATAHHAGIAREKIMANIGRYGNTTAATIPLCLADWESVLRQGDHLIMTSFGSGFAWGACFVRWAYDGEEATRKDPVLAEAESP